ncbi:predicted protein [Thalassiosira pseudonana CCMP1335]|uniref:BCNT-C domain-containing protein n=1 Tax=Thalassiosira pseudonana TaxID=35128 RepID=B8C6P4_THAPS|nr:predicted protein [Thalassiosira pseudonana CCMP1335]EED90840.1 predicted protein [Thalassiosira pseudonana CCMP1335]
MSSDEEDEDYIPGADEPASDDENDTSPADEEAADEDSGPSLSITKLKAVDDAFLELFGYEYVQPTVTRGESQKKTPVKSKREMKQRRILSSIFGRQSSIKLMSHAKNNASRARPKKASGGMIRLEKRVIKEVKRFAGQEITVEKVVMVPIMAEGTVDNDEEMMISTTTEQSTKESTTTNTVAASTRAKPKQPPASGLDSLLTEISRPEKLSTISKTSADWDLFKSKNANSQLKEELEQKATGKEAFLVKKDFLSRVDERRFQIEKGERDRERAKRGK